MSNIHFVVDKEEFLYAQKTKCQYKTLFKIKYFLRKILNVLLRRRQKKYISIPLSDITSLLRIVAKATKDTLGDDVPTIYKQKKIVKIIKQKNKDQKNKTIK